MSREKNLRNQSGRGNLLGIPLLLFISGIILLSIAGFNHFKYAFYLSRLFLHDTVRTEVLSKEQLEIDIWDAQTQNSTKEIRYPSLGEQYGDLIISSADIDYPVYHGDREVDLIKGIGHYQGSRYPGEGGNVVLAGHRQSVFRNLKYIEVGDTVEFRTTFGIFVYRISEIKITHRDDKSILQPTQEEILTLYTCYPVDGIRANPSERYVVICTLEEKLPSRDVDQRRGHNEDT